MRQLALNGGFDSRRPHNAECKPKIQEGHAMINKAMDKIRDEMAKATDAVEMVGEIVMLYLQSDEKNAGRILAEGKTLNGAYGAMWVHAIEKRMEYMSTDKAAEIIAEYYGMEPKKMMDMWQLASKSGARIERR